jgi:hypothetical protein
LYLPTLATRFDFIDDGNLVYPAAPMPLHQRLHLVWDKIVANYQHLGPFRPVLWAHWETEAELLGANTFLWRSARLFWAMLATGTLLWLLRELRIRPVAAVLVAALAMWNPYRGEIWTSLTLSEGVAMPYALLALVCAIRAARSPRPLIWDVFGFLGVLAALGCKNTFVALIPVQLLLRIAPDGGSFREGWRRHGRRACLLALSVLIPLGHYVYFKLSWHPGQYVTEGPSLAQLGRLLSSIKGAISLDFLGLGVALSVMALFLSGRRSNQADVWSGSETEERAGLGLIWHRHRAACLAGLLLLACGIGVYLPLSMVSGRYSIPAVWGADLCLAALLSVLAEATAVMWRRLAYVAIIAGVAIVAVANLGKQDKFAARATLLWQALEFVENQAPTGTTLAWMDSPELNLEEGIHFCWHLGARGRNDLAWRLLDHQGLPQKRVELPESGESPALLFTGTQSPPPGGQWQMLREFKSFYWGHTREYHCYLYQGAEPRGQESAQADRRPIQTAEP